jgi:ABC-type sugar transport system substrate-binding protein
MYNFPCSLNDFAVKLCQGFTAAAKALPAGYRLEQKAGTNFSDPTALNTLIQTSLALKPAGMIVFSDGPASAVPVLTRACNEGVKVFITDSNMPTLQCRTELLETDNYGAGVTAAKWLLAHPPRTKLIGLVTAPPGTFASDDSRLAGFRATVQAKGYETVVVTSSPDIASTRTAVTNMLTAHPSMSAIFSVTGFFGSGVVQGMIGSHRMNIEHITMDGNLPNDVLIPNKGVTMDLAQDPFLEGTMSVANMVKVLSGHKVPALVLLPTLVVDKTNVKQFIASGKV